MSGYDGTEVAMVFDGDTGNAIDAFPYTAEELRRRADELDGIGRVTITASPFLAAPFEAEPTE